MILIMTHYAVVIQLEELMMVELQTVERLMEEMMVETMVLTVIQTTQDIW